MKDTPEYQLVELLKQYDGVDYLSVKRRGNSLTIYSTGADGSQNHAKFTSLGDAVWGLSFPRHTGRWEKTPFIGSLEALVGTLVEDFRFYIERV